MSLPEYLGAKVVESTHQDIRKKGMKKEAEAAANKDKKA
jgi:hypothetical protein